MSAFSCWEVAKLVQGKRFQVEPNVLAWIDAASAGARIAVVPLTAEIAVEANQLPGDFHRDPADQIIVATARRLAIPLLTADAKILAYPHVGTIA